LLVHTKIRKHLKTNNPTPHFLTHKPARKPSVKA
jgi:hypothetical protein